MSTVRPVLVLAAAAVAGTALTAPSAPAHSQATEPARGLELITQTYAVTGGGTARLEFVVHAEVPEIAPTTTAVPTTTTTTTTTSTTTTTPPAGESPTTSTPATEPAEGTGGVVPTATTATPTTTTEPPPPPRPELTVQVRAHRPVTSRFAVEAALDGSTGPIIDIVEYPVDGPDGVGVFDPVSGDRRIVLDVGIAANTVSDTRLDLLEPGLYPLTVQVRRAEQLVTSTTTFVEVVDPTRPGRGPFTFAVLAAVGEPAVDAAGRPLGTAADRVADLAELAAAFDEPIAAAVPPALIRALIATDPEGVTQMAGALDADDVLVGMPDVEFDASAAADAGLGAEFQRRFALGEGQLGAAVPGVRVVRSAWVADGSMTGAGAGLLRGTGVQFLVVTADRYTDLTDAQIATDTSLFAATELDDGTTMAIAVVDPITELLAPERSTGRNPAEDALHLMAVTSAIRHGQPPDLRSLVLTTPDIRVPDPEVLGHLAGYVAEHPDYAFEPIDALVARTNAIFVDGRPMTIDLDERPAVSLRDRLERVDAMRLRVADVASMLPDDDPRPAQWEGRLRDSFSTGITSAEARRRIGTVGEEVDEIRSQVRPPEVFSFTVTGEETPIPVRIENRGSTPLRVVVRAEAENLVFPHGDVEAVLQPNVITEVPIAVTARSNGRFPVTVLVTTPFGSQLTEPVELTARVNTLTGLGRVVTVGALLVLLTWWLTYFRRRRRTRLDAAVDGAQQRHPTATERAEQLSSVRSPDAEEARSSPVPPTHEQQGSDRPAGAPAVPEG